MRSDYFRLPSTNAKHNCQAGYQLQTWVEYPQILEYTPNQDLRLEPGVTLGKKLSIAPMIYHTKCQPSRSSGSSSRVRVRIQGKN